MKGLRILKITAATILGMLVSLAPASAQEVAPGRIFNPPGLQFDLATAYNSTDDEYLIAYAGVNGFVPQALRLSPAGVILGAGAINVGGSGDANLFGVAYNPDRNEYLFIFRNDSLGIFGQFIAADGTLVGTRFLVGTGNQPRIHYSSASQNYLVVFDNFAGGFKINYTVVSADSTLPNPVLVASTLLTGAFSADLTYSPVTDRYFVCFVRDFSPSSTRANVYGRYFDASTFGVGPEIGIGLGFENQQTPRCAHSVEGDRVLVQFEDWVNAGANSADVGAHYVDANGLVSARFFPFQTQGSGGWDVPGPLAYNSLTRTFMSSSYFGATAYYREIDPAAVPESAGLGPLQVLGGANLNATGAVGRPDPVDPQVLFVSKISFGEDGIHANITHLPTPPPSFTSNSMPTGFNGVAYSEMVPIAGGTPPLSFAFVPGFGDLPNGLSGPDPNTGLITGVPTQFGNFSFRVSATDSDSPTRTVTGDLTMSVTLPPPTPSYPTEGSAINTAGTPFSWTAVGGATQYQIQVDNLTTATNNVIDVTTAGTTQTMAGLTDGSYRWRVRTIGGGNDSPFTPNVTFEIDTVAPDAPGAFIANAGGTPVPIVNFAGSGEATGFPYTNMTDGNFSTAWRPNDIPTPGTIIVDLVMQNAKDINKVRLRSLDTTAEGFPITFQIQTTQVYDQFSTVASATNFSAAANTWYDFNFPTVTAGFVRLLITQPAQVGSVFRVELAEVQIVEAASGAGDVAISWNAPGDDGTVGTATSYDLRYAIGPMGSFNYTGATMATNEPSPAAATTPQSLSVSGLMAETIYTFGMRAEDNANNLGAVALSQVTTPGIPPEPVADLSASTAGPTSVQLSFTAPHEDANMGTAVTSYEIRYSQSTINAGNFGAASLVPNPPSPPKTPGLTETVTVGSLPTNTLFYFALISYDDVGNASMLSNVTTGETDAIDPGPVTNFMAMPAGASGVNAVTIFDKSGEYSVGFTADLVIDSDANTLWSTPGRSTLQDEFVTLDLGSLQVVTEVRLRAAPSAAFFPVDFVIEFSTNGTSYSQVHSETGFGAADGAIYNFATSGVTRYIRVRSTLNNQVSGIYFSQLAEVEFTASGAAGSLMLLSWTSSGDDGAIGTATSYDIRYQVGGSIVFGSAMTVDGEPTPAISGTNQSYIVTGLDAEKTYSFGIQVTDDGGNMSAVSTTSGNTQGVAPEAVTDLATTTLSTTSIRLTWTAPHEDANMGSAVTSYEFRYSTSPIDENNFVSATLVPGVPGPAAPGTMQMVDVNSLSIATTYYFAMISRDDLSNASALSNVPTGFTQDGTPPGAVTGAMASATSGAPTLSISSVSGEYSSDFDAAKLIDGNVNTLWSTPGRATLQNEEVVVDLGTTLTLTNVRLRSGPSAGFFPVDFTIDLSLDGTNFTNAHTETGFAAADATWYPISMGSQPARFVRVRSTNANQTSGLYFNQIAEFEANGTASPGILLSWTSSGDDGATGTASSYDIRYQQGPSISFGSATTVMGEPMPQPSGSDQSFIIPGLSSETQYTFGIQAIDEGGLVSTVTTVTQNTVGVAPEAVSDLRTETQSTTTVRVLWTAPHEDGNMGTKVTSYDLRYSTSPIDASNFGAASQVPNEPAPADPGITQQVDVMGLTLGTTYYFAMISTDDLGNQSALSNVPTGATSDGVAPGDVTILTATPASAASLSVLDVSGEYSPSFSANNMIDANASTIWSSPGRSPQQNEQITFDLGNLFALDDVRLQAAPDPRFFPIDFTIHLSTDGTNFSLAHTETGLVATSGAWYTFTMSAQTARYVRVITTNSQPVGNAYFTQMAEFQANGTASPSINLSWTSSGDDGSVGTAALYDIRYQAGASITFGSATQAMGEPVPLVSGTNQSFLVSGLTAESQYTFGIQVQDEGGLTSSVVTVTQNTAGSAPEAVTDLTLTATSTTSIKIDWTAPHEDGDMGTKVTSYDMRYSTSPINAGNFGSATPVPGVPAPADPNVGQTVNLNSLTTDTTYYVAMTSTDDQSNVSPISNLPMATTFDTTDPGPVTGLTATPVAGSSMSLVSTSGDFGAGFNGEKVIDGDINTYWSTPARSSVQPEQITIDLGATYTLDNVRLRAPSNSGAFFPVDFTIEISTNGSTFTVAHTETGFSATAGTLYTFATGSQTARYVKIAMTNANSFFGSFYSQIGEFEPVGTTAQGMRLNWTSSGDDGTTGTAKTYDIRYQTGASITFGSAMQATGEPLPLVSGTAQSFTITGLTANTQYTFAIQAIDDSNLVSTLTEVTQTTNP